MKARGVPLAVSGSRVQHSPEMLPAEQCSQPWGCVDGGFPGCGGLAVTAGSPGSNGVNTDQAGFSLPVSDCARKLLVLLFFHTARQVSKYTDRAQEELK